MKKRMFSTALFVVLLLLTSCANHSGPEQAQPLQATGLSVIHEPEFGGVYIKMMIDEFNRLGFKYGDSVDVTFSNGYALSDLPYYNGYYVDAGDPLLVAYPGYDYIKAAFNYGDDLWITAGLTETDTADIVLKKSAAFLDVQEARDIHYSDERNDYADDVTFANFRSVNAGQLKENVLYRSASPCDNQHNRAPYVDALMKEAGVNCILDLSDNEGKIEGYIAAEDFNSPYFLSLYQTDKVIPLAMNMNYASDEFRAKIADGFSAMAKQVGPYLVHCTEGKDRTGFVCMLLEAFAGASYDEIIDDYMLTYDNYYKITESSDPAKYATIKEKNIDAMLSAVIGDPDADITAVDLTAAAEAFLKSAGMSEEDVLLLRSRLSADMLSV